MTRVFVLDLPVDRINSLSRVEEPRLAAALGVDTVDHDFAEVIRTDDLRPIGLTGYLEEGYGIPGQLLEGDRERLDAIEGTILLVRSPAFGGAETLLQPEPGVSLVEVFREVPAAPSFEPIHSDGATGTIAPPDLVSAPTPGRRFRAGWIVALGVLLAVLAVYFAT